MAKKMENEMETREYIGIIRVMCIIHCRVLGLGF